MTRDRARKKAIRARMAASGEPYNAAARNLGTAGPTDAPAAADEIVARLNNTLAVPRARAELRLDWDITRGPGQRERRRPGPVGRLARLAATAVWDRISPEMDFASARERFRHLVGDGFVEPAADQYQIDFGEYSMMRFDRQSYSGASGRPLADRYRSATEPDEPLEFLKLLRDVTGARYVGPETVRGVPCRVIAASSGSGEVTVWIDGEHIRRLRTEEVTVIDRTGDSIKRTRTLELWDFGADDGPADWTHMPGFRTARHTAEPGRSSD